MLEYRELFRRCTSDGHLTAQGIAELLVQMNLRNVTAEVVPGLLRTLLGVTQPELSPEDFA